METTFTESPAFEVKAPAPAKAALPADDAAGDGSTSRADLEAALALLNPQDGDDPQTVEAMEAALRSREAELEAKFEAKLAQLEAKLTEGDGPLSSVARSVVAHLSEAPPNWHQATVLFASTQEPNARLRVVSLAISMLIVACQCMVTVGVWVGTINKSCHTSDDCKTKGMFCMLGWTDRCHPCGGTTPLPWQTDPATGGTLNWILAADYVGFNTSMITEVCADPTERPGTDDYGSEIRFAAAGVASWCETCVHNDGQVHEVSTQSRAKSITDAMGPFDWIALILSSVVVALTVAAELKDIELCALSIRHAGDSIPRAWRFALSMLGGIRRWVFLPTLCTTIPWLVLSERGDALSVCFNTIAMLFLCEIDNMAYAIGLGDKLRARVEVEGRVELGEVEVDALMLSKTVHVCVLIMAIPSAVWLGGSGDFQSINLGDLAYLAFWFAGVVEAVTLADGAVEACKEVGMVTGRFLLGLVLFLSLYGAATQM